MMMTWFIFAYRVVQFASPTRILNFSVLLQVMVVMDSP
jgi:hypothetical protein